MAQTDLNVANASGAAVRADLNNHLSALATLSAGATAPSVTFPNLWWFDTANNLLKQRDNANTAWVTVGAKDASGWRPYFNGAELPAAINDLTAETAPAAGDLIGLYDLSAAAYRKMTLANALKVINDLTADASPDAAADYVATYDASAGAAKKVLLSALGGITWPASQAASGSAVLFTGIPSSARLIYVALEDVSLSGTDNLLLQLGSGGIDAASYVSGTRSGDGVGNDTSGFVLTAASTAAEAWSGVITLVRIGSGNTWSMSAVISQGTDADMSGGSKTLSGALDRLRITSDGTDTLDGSGNVQIGYM